MPKPKHATRLGITTDLRNEDQVESLAGRANSPTPTNQPGIREVPLEPKDHVEAAPVPGPASEPHPTLEVLASRIKESNELYLKLGRQIEALFTRRGEVGLGMANALIEANAQCPGHWESYLAEECGMDARLAQVYMTGAMLVG